MISEQKKITILGKSDFSISIAEHFFSIAVLLISRKYFMKPFHYVIAFKLFLRVGFDFLECQFYGVFPT